ncbi:hypothetical protein [Luteolibacter marinus]|uniref:hypothetical protein n=1 Tax=Luteolibacter marinus TaxID=2776705 RepID=UPI0018666545|nr:hypothetical protein [Luteolibacter marinus]
MIRPYLLLLLLAGNLHAEGTTVTCRILCLNRAKDAPEKFVANGADGAIVDCPLPIDTPSNPVVLAADGAKLGFYASAGDPSPAVTAKIPSGLSDLLLIFVPGEEAGAPPYRALVLDHSPKGFPDDGCLVVNLYQKDIRFVIGEHRGLLPAGKSYPLARPAKRDDFNMAGLAFQFQSGEKWRTAAETMVRFAGGQRHLFVTFVDSKTKRPRLRSFRVAPR